ncbi:MAG: hypothetical protein D6717_04105 [Gammaproteobacteria bacterium]|nr:MAG: hypothetical protein D6717_04105 [Gammaproteobacteria bacterium]
MPLPPRPAHKVRYRIEHHDPVRKILIQAVVIGLVVLLGWGLFRLGFRLSGFEELAAEKQIHSLSERVDFLEGENRRLNRELAYQRQSAAIEHKALDEVRRALETAEAENLRLKEELSFYRSIVSPSAMRPGLHIQSLQLEKGAGKGEYHYRLVLTLVRGNNRVAKGRARLTVLGTHQGRPATVEVGGSEALKFSFRYFQRLEGDLKLPEGFEPHAVRVVATPSVKRLEATEHEFPWQVSKQAGES